MKRILGRSALSVLVVALGVVAPPRAGERPRDVSIDVVEVPVPALSAASDGVTAAAAPATIKTEPFRMIALSARGSAVEGEDVLQVRTRDGTSGWSAWRDVPFVGDEGPDGDSDGWNWSAPVWTGDGDRVQIRKGARSDVSLRRLRVHAMDIPRGQASPPDGAAYAMTEGVGVISRAQWGANESLRKGSPGYSERVRMAFVHHTVNSNSYSPEEADDLIRGIYAFHTQSRGWEDIGYNFIVDRFGRVYEGRAGGIDRAVIGAHAEGFNTGSTGVAVLGNYDGVEPPAAVNDALRRLLAWKLDVSHVDPQGTATVVSRGSPRFAAGTSVTLPAIAGHRDTGLTGCPGDRLYASLPRLRAAVGSTGLPKMYDALPVTAVTTSGGAVDITARFSTSLPWALTVTDSGGAVMATATGAGNTASYRWSGTNLLGAYAGAGDYRWTISAAGPAGVARPASGSIRITAPHPDGSVVRAAGTSTAWVIKGDRKIALGAGAPLASRVTDAEVATVSPSTLARYASDGAPFRDGALVRTPDARVWLVSNGERRHIIGPSVFAALGLDGRAIIHVTDALAAAMPVGSPIASATPLPSGMFVKSATAAAIYRVVDGTLRHVPTMSVLMSYRIRPEDVAIVSPETLAATGPAGAPLGFREGALIVTPDSRVSVISNGLRRWIAGPPVFIALGYDFANAIRTTDGEAALSPEGPALAQAVPPDGSVVTDGGEAWLVSGGLRVPASWEAATTRVTRAEVARPVAQALEAVPVRGLGWRDGSFLGTPDGRFFLVSGGKVRRIANAEVFRALGLDMTRVKPASLPSLALHPAGPAITSTTALVDGMVVRAPTSPAMFLVERGGTVKRPVSAGVLRSHGVSPAEVAVVAPEMVDRLTTGTPLAFRDGSLVRTFDGKVSIVTGGRRRWIAHAETFESLGFKWEAVIPITDAEATLVPASATL